MARSISDEEVSPRGRSIVTEARPGVRWGRTPALQPPGGTWRRISTRSASARTSTGGTGGCGRSRAVSNASCQADATRVGAEVGHDELHPALGRLVEVGRGSRTRRPEPRPRPARRARHERVQQHGRRRRLAEAAAGPHLVARYAVGDDRDQPGVVDEGVVAAAGRAAERHVERTAAPRSARPSGRSGCPRSAGRRGSSRTARRGRPRRPRSTSRCAPCGRRPSGWTGRGGRGRRGRPRPRGRAPSAARRSGGWSGAASPRRGGPRPGRAPAPARWGRRRRGSAPAP